MRRSESAEQKLRGTGIILATLVVGVVAFGGLYTYLFVSGMSGDTVSEVYCLLIVVGLVIGVAFGLIYGVSQLISGVALSAEEAKIRRSRASQETPP